jgi:CDP-diacylglycerol--glycerol-3-phosphate 3-phosphatidyltransferase
MLKLIKVYGWRIIMNLPNKITLFRVILVPVFVVIMLLDKGIIPYQNIVGCVIFCIACISDFFDGYLARKWQLITNFGKFMDPLADKLLVCSALILFVELGRIPAWAVIIIIGREFIVSGVRLIAADAGTVIAANMLGKIKTNAQMFMSIFMILNIDNQVFYIITQVLMWASVVLTVVSLVEYTYSNRKLFLDSK